jgi:SpoVK/Ycf46/Vps4 family AAA+-type ATPase
MPRYNPDGKPETWIRISAVPLNDTNQIDPKLADFLPPEILQQLMREIQNGSNGVPQKEEQKEPETPIQKIKYDFKMVNCNYDLKELVKKLKSSKRTDYGILLYGVSGSGKSYFGQYLAQELGMKFIKKRASDMIAKFVGETEQNIAAAFKEAKEKKAILLLDEADSFLFSREFAKQDFQAASVNELLTQMEDHPYPFIMTTNLRDKIDPAANRRFVFKWKFEYMTKDNIKAGLKTYFGKGIKFTDEQYDQLKYISAGDFKTAKHKLDILEDGKYTSQNVFEYLMYEQKEKDLDKGSKEISF